MKVEKTEIATKLKKLKGFVKTEKETVSGILYKDLSLIASDGEVIAKAVLECQPALDETFVIPITAVNFIDKLPQGVAEITADKSTVKIKCGKAKGTFANVSVFGGFDDESKWTAVFSDENGEVFSNIILDCHLWSDVWWGKAEPIYVTSYPRANGNHKDANWRVPKGQTVGKCGEVSRIYFNNIYATSENGCFIGGDTKDKVRDIYLNNVHLNLKKVTSYDGGVYDKRPCRGEGFIYNKVYGVYVEQATNVEIDELKVIADPKINYGGKTFGIDD